MKLYGPDLSPYVKRILILLEELDIPFDRDPKSWRDADESFSANTPVKKVPLLDLGETEKPRFIFESKVIAEVLYERKGKNPQSDFQKTLYNPALHREDQLLLNALDSGVDSAINVFVLGSEGVTKAQVKYLERQDNRLKECLAWVNSQYENKTTFTEGVVSFLDISVVSSVIYLRMREMINVEDYKNLLRLEEILKKRKSIAKFY